MENKVATVNGANALATLGTVKPIYGTISDDEKLRKIGVDPGTLPDEAKAELLKIYNEQMAEEGSGAVARFKILKDSRNFETSSGDAVKEIRGVVVYHTPFDPAPRTRWVEGEKLPACKSTDGITGFYADGNGVQCTKHCSDCEFNSRSQAFNSALDYKEQCKASPFIVILVKDVPTPVVLSLAPTMIKHAKEYFDKKLRASAIPAASRETIIKLEVETKGSNSWSVPKFELGDPVPPAEFVRICSLRAEIKDSMASYLPEKEDIQGADESQSFEDPFASQPA